MLDFLIVCGRWPAMFASAPDDEDDRPSSYATEVGAVVSSVLLRPFARSNVSIWRVAIDLDPHFKVVVVAEYECRHLLSLGFGRHNIVPQCDPKQQCTFSLCKPSSWR
jgi:hypothetical protein